MVPTEFGGFYGVSVRWGKAVRHLPGMVAEGDGSRIDVFPSGFWPPNVKPEDAEVAYIPVNRIPEGIVIREEGAWIMPENQTQSGMPECVVPIGRERAHVVRR